MTYHFSGHFSFMNLVDCLKYDKIISSNAGFLPVLFEISKWKYITKKNSLRALST